MEKLNEVWLLYGQPIVSSALFSTICTAVMVAVIKGTISKKYNKVNVDNELMKIAEIVLERFKGMTFKQNIEPLVSSELLDIRKDIELTLKGDTETLKEIDLKLAQMMYDFTKFFEHSNGIPEGYRELVKKDLNDILELTSTQIVNDSVETIPEIEDVKVEPKKEKHKEKHNDAAR